MLRSMSGVMYSTFRRYRLRPEAGERAADRTTTRETDRRRWRGSHRSVRERSRCPDRAVRPATDRSAAVEREIPSARRILVREGIVNI